MEIDIEKAKAKARRLNALAKRGVGGEKDTAQRKLDELLERTGIRIEEIDEDLNVRVFKIKSADDYLILTNIILAVNPYTKIIPKDNTITCTLDKEDHTEIQARFKYFIKLWLLEKDLFQMSFFTKHKAHLQPDEYAYNKFRDTKNEKNSAFEQAAKQEKKMNSNLSEALNTDQPKEFNQGDINKQAQDRLNLRRMQSMLGLLMECTYTPTR